MITDRLAARSAGAAFSDAVIAGGRLAFLAGQGPILNGTPVGGSIREQTLVALQNLADILCQLGPVRAGKRSPGAIVLPGRSRCRTRRRGGPVPGRIPRTRSRSGARPRPRRHRRGSPCLPSVAPPPSC